jgi:aspartokinase/homoserine dehydrogenase 1
MFRKVNTMKVLKFGGTSIADAKGIRKTTEIIKRENGKVVIVSAFGGVTNKLIKAGQLAEKGDMNYVDFFKEIELRHNTAIKSLGLQNDLLLSNRINKLHEELKRVLEGIFLLREISPKSKDLFLSFGEKISANLLTFNLLAEGLKCEYTDSAEFITTDDHFGNARIIPELTDKSILDIFSNSENIHVIPGFTGKTENGVITTLGRGGSDLSATYIGSVLNAEEIQIWTDVNGFMTADPNKVTEAFSLTQLSYDEALELSYFGAKVLLPHSIRPAKENRVPIVIKNTYDQTFTGTIVSVETSPLKNFAKGITSIDNVSLVNIRGSGMIGVRGISARVFKTLAEKNINIILITQASSEQSICVAIDPLNVKKAKSSLQEEFLLEINAGMIDEIEIDNNLSIVAVVGNSMKNTPGVAGRIFNTFGENGVNVIAIAQGASELNISIVIDRKDENLALNILHDTFFSPNSVMNLIIAGKGLIGSELIKQIAETKEDFKRKHHIELRVIAILDSKRKIFSKTGLDLSKWQQKLKDSDLTSEIPALVQRVINNNIINTVFIDCTASEHVAAEYACLMQNRISIVAANKIANTKPMKDYLNLKNAAVHYNIHYLYETNAGAALPIIDTLNNLIDSGDEITKFEAILSGTISYLFNAWTSEKKFSSIVHEAKNKGFTEPDPRVDLSGTDFARKMLLLSRECGSELELKDIKIEPLLPQDCMQAASVEEFFKKLEENNQTFKELILQAEKKDRKLRWIGSYENGEVSIKLESVDNTHPFYSMSGSDNIIAIETNRYKNPIVIKGAGAGAEVTAAGVLADIFKIAASMEKRWHY